MRCATWGACAFVLAVALSSAARGAEVECLKRWTDQNAPHWPSEPRPTVGTCLTGGVRGTISKGDFEKVLALYRQSHPFLGTFLLESPGGDVDEALKIGRLFRKYLVNAVASTRRTRRDDSTFFFLDYPDIRKGLCAEEECACASACALIWFGAPERNGTVGLHRPRYAEVSAFGALAPADAALAYAQVLDRVSHYLEEMEVPRPIIEKMISTGSGDIEWIDEDRANRPPGFTEWQDASCGHFTSQEQEAWGELMLKGNDNLSKYEKLAYDDLTKKMSAKWICDSALVRRNRQKLPAP